MTGMLASVANLAEARLALASGVDIIDLKNPRAGALGALSVEEVRLIVEQLRTQTTVPISATIGDLPMEPTGLMAATRTMAATGVAYVKLGFFPGGNWPETIGRLSDLPKLGARLIAVLFGDLRPDLSLLTDLARGGFTGVMLDTMDKTAGSLPTICSSEYLASFVTAARKNDLICGLAGSLREHEISALLELSPDYLGFRGALCHQRQRTDSLDLAAIRRIRQVIDCVELTV